MNIGDIAERLIEAAEIEEAAHRSRVGPRGDQSMALPYAHSFADMNGWGAERLKEEQKAFQASIASQPSASQVTEAEEATGWYALVPSEQNRTALAGWVRCQAQKNAVFKDWCFRNGIHPETGRRRKDRALEQISAHLSGSVVQDSDNEGLGVLPDTPENAYLKATFEKSCGRPATFGWRSDPSLKLVSDPDQQDFSWADKRNKRRRQQAAKRQDAA